MSDLFSHSKISLSLELRLRLTVDSLYFILKEGAFLLKAKLLGDKNFFSFFMVGFRGNFYNELKDVVS
jgi:hypothetical protein